MRLSRRPSGSGGGNPHTIWVESQEGSRPCRVPITNRATDSDRGAHAEGSDIDYLAVTQLMSVAEPIVDELCAAWPMSALRDKVLRVIETLAQAEAAVRVVEGDEPRVVEHYVPPWRLRPEYPIDLAVGVARNLGISHRSPRRVLWRIGAAAHLIGRRGMSLTRRRQSESANVLLVTGNGSYQRAIEGVRRKLPIPALVLDESLNTRAPDPHVFSRLSWWEPILAVGARNVDLSNRLREVWSAQDWWGNRWGPEGLAALKAVVKCYEPAARLFTEAWRRAIPDVRVIVTPQSPSLQLRCLIRAADERDTPIVAVPHGQYVDGPEWRDVDVACWCVTDFSFAAVLRRRGVGDRIAVVGPTFLAPALEADVVDFVIAVRPIETGVVASERALIRLLVDAIDAVQRINRGASIGIRVHPRQSIDEIRSLIRKNEIRSTVRVGYHLVGRVWIGPESSSLELAHRLGAPVVLITRPGEPFASALAEGHQLLRAEGIDDLVHVIRRASEKTSPSVTDLVERIRTLNAEVDAMTDILVDKVMRYT